ncbi:YcjF family protein [Halocynthiibacter namhaensis]|uniref:YcjF family protein n=1 Tax=Halocynthiibacter namhaensis TaxID=1290553 RepID=UPI000579779D|nr:TIGR01620 family protein [Halocynthiibacter namhaensis]
MIDTERTHRGPVRFDIAPDETRVAPSDAPAVPDQYGTRQGAAMEQIVRLAGRRRSVLSRLFWWLLGTLISLALGLWGWDIVTALIARNTVLSQVVLGISVLLIGVILLICLRELLGFLRLKRLDRIHDEALQLRAHGDLTQARALTKRLARLYQGRETLSWALQNFQEKQSDSFDVDGHLALAEREILAPIDQAAQREVEAATRHVATVTALVPLAFADVLTAFVSNLRMIRRIAELYGGRTGSLGNWRLMRSVLTHLAATGAVAVGDDLIGSVAGGSVLSKFSRRFGEGIVNGALTARVGIAAMEVCRPMPFVTQKPPRVTNILSRGLAGLFGRSENAGS